METDPIAEAEDLIASGQAGEAAKVLRARLDAGRGGLLARLTLVKALLASRDVAAALEEARETAAINPGVAVAAMSLGEALLAAHALPMAIAEMQRALRLDPALERARFLMALAWLEAGEAEKALAIFAELESSPVIENLMVRARAIQHAPRSDAGYVRHLFDQFSADYDTRMLGQLAYAAPEVLRDLADLVMPGRDHLSILDLGCGTGLAGAMFHNRAARLDGVDLSPAMIAKAAARGIYDSLIVADIEALPPGRYDLILAADTLVYLGDLAPLFRTLGAHLAPDGYFLFTTEAKDGEGFELGPKRRWRHSEAYLRQEAEGHGFSIAGLVAASPRTEANQPVAGFAVALTLS
ncbi:MAG TPA: methyltransferase domain-containing protein [Rhizomicrobium sp.]